MTMRACPSSVSAWIKRAIQLAAVAATAAGLLGSAQLLASEGEKPRDIKYVFTPPAPQSQS